MTSGLPNAGKSCYLNSVLQALYYTEELREFILNEDIDNKDGVMFYLQCIFKRMKADYINKDNKNEDEEMMKIIYEVFKSLCGKFREIKEEDANHFVTYLMNELIQNEGEMNITERRRVTDLFRGRINFQIICDECNDFNEESCPVTSQYFFTLPLTLHNDISLDQLLLQSTAEEPILNGKCSRINCKSTNIFKQAVVTVWPQYLIINLCRIRISNDNVLRKIDATVNIKDLKLEVAPNISTENECLDKLDGTENSLKEQKMIFYSLYAVINHFGTPYSGHYTCMALTDFLWVHFNDMAASSVDVSDVINPNNNLLFFKKDEPKV